MACAYSSLLRQIRTWSEDVCAQGYFEAAHLQALAAEPDATPLFIDCDQEQPLKVAFLGGTGVGKSALLNRLAGAMIAQSGIERPTSREVTLYHHASVQLQHLPDDLALESIRTGVHHQDKHRHIVWLDMPDFDSIADYNQHLVLQWLPHIDILIYVVSPERYRDAKTWRLLQREGAKHAWLFVMNQWDKAQPEQMDDLQTQLKTAGFNQPLLFKTSCTHPEGDDFQGLVQQIQQLSGHLQRLQLQHYLQQQRFLELQVWLEVLQQQFNKRDFEAWREQTTVLWQKTTQTLQHGMEWSLRECATQLAEHIGPLTPIQLWDDWAQSRLQDALDDMAVSAEQFAIPVKPIRHTLNAVKHQAERTLHSACELSVRRAFSQPGKRWQRILLFLTAIAETLLPLTAMAIVGYQVFVGYYHSTMQTQAYLGVEFAVHSILLIALSWLLPFFLQRKLQPSRISIARQGLQIGVEQGLASIKMQIDTSVHDVQQQHQAQCQQLQRWLTLSRQQQQTGRADGDWQRLLNQTA